MIDLAVPYIRYQVDPAHSDSTAWYVEAIVDSVTMRIEFPRGSDRTTYVLHGRQEFFLVRGDAAVLDGDQESRNDRWYFRRWDDRSAHGAGPGVPPGGPLGDDPTWGGMKARDRF